MGAADWVCQDLVNIRSSEYVSASNVDIWNRYTICNSCIFIGDYDVAVSEAGRLALFS